MSFADTSGSTKTPFQERKKTEYIELTPGMHVIRILQENAVRFDTHWLNKGSIVCLGEECPICQNNKRLMMEYSAGKKFKEQKDWNPPSKRFFVNVLDRTVVKVCTNCGKEVKKVGNAFPNTCPECDTFIKAVAEKPLNKVKVLARGVTVFEQLNAYETTILDAEGNPVPITDYDIALSVVGTGKTATITPIPMQNKNDKVEVDEEDLFDLTNAVIKLTAPEIMDLQKGVAIRDILVARKSEDKKFETATEKLVGKASADVEKTLKELFPD